MKFIWASGGESFLSDNFDLLHRDLDGEMKNLKTKSD